MHISFFRGPDDLTEYSKVFLRLFEPVMRKPLSLMLAVSVGSWRLKISRFCVWPLEVLRGKSKFLKNVPLYVWYLPLCIRQSNVHIQLYLYLSISCLSVCLFSSYTGTQLMKTIHPRIWSSLSLLFSIFVQVQRISKKRTSFAIIMRGLAFFFLHVGQLHRWKLTS